MSRQVLARNALFMVAQVAFSALLLLVTYWLMMRALSIEEIGLWSLVVGSTLVTRLSEMGLGAGVLRFVAADRSAGQPQRAALTVGMALLLVTLLAGTLALALQPLLATYLLYLVPPALQGAVGVLLPAALLAVVLGTAANVFLSAIDGCQRMDLRATLLMASSAVQLGGTWFVLPRWGVAGLGLVQAGQSAFLLLAGAGIAFWLLGRRPRDYFGFDRVRLGELLRYGGGMQLSALGQLLFDPLLKVMLAAFSGLALAGYYDLASRILLQFRSVIVAAYMTLVPHIAAQSGAFGIDPERVRSTYRQAFALLLYVLVPYLCCVAAALPLALTLWKGAFDPTFLGVALLQFVAIGINMISPPAYLLYTGLGTLRWNIASHLVNAAVLIVLGGALGVLAGGTGVLIAGALALAGGSLLVPAAFHREFGLGLGELVPRRALAGLVLMTAAFAASTAIAVGQVDPGWAVLWGLPLAVGAAAAVLAWRDPLRSFALAQIPGLKWLGEP